MNPDNLSQAVAAMHADWDLIDALLGGTPAMRAAGEKYLPKRRLEEDTDYRARLNCATLFPAFAETVQNMVGRVFAEPLLINEDVPAWVRTDVLPDVDRQGRNIHVFSTDWFRSALAYGLTSVLVESPRVAGVKTREDQRKAGVRPYVIQLKQRDVLGWKLDDSGKLLQVRIARSRLAEDGPFGQKMVPQVHVYEPGQVSIWEKPDKDWALVETVQTGFAGIPLVTLYTARTGMLTAMPPLRELAYLNGKHWVQQSSNDTLIETASVPILAVTGVRSGDEIVIGAKNAVRLPQGADMRYVEHSGAAISAGREALTALKEEMRQSGAKLLAPQAGQAKTAAQVDEEAARDNSALGAMALSLQDTLALLLDTIAAYRGEAAGGTIKVQPNLDADLVPNESMKTLLDMESKGILSPQTVFEESQRRGFVGEDRTWEDEQTRVREQAAPAP